MAVFIVVDHSRWTLEMGLRFFSAVVMEGRYCCRYSVSDLFLEISRQRASLISSIPSSS